MRRRRRALADRQVAAARPSPTAAAAVAWHMCRAGNSGHGGIGCAEQSEKVKLLVLVLIWVSFASDSEFMIRPRKMVI